jgi:Peptidase family M28
MNHFSGFHYSDSRSASWGANTGLIWKTPSTRPPHTTIARRALPERTINGSSIAALLVLAHALVDNPQRRTLRFVAFTNEERPFLRSRRMGSRVFALGNSCFFDPLVE